MRAYVIRRLLLVIPTLFILSVLVFLSVRFLPGDVIEHHGQPYVGHCRRPKLIVKLIERMLGLDVPDPTCSMDAGSEIFCCAAPLGESLLGGWPIEERMLGRLPVTAELGVLAIVIGLVIALPVGIYSAVRQYTAADYLGRFGRHHGAGERPTSGWERW